MMRAVVTAVVCLMAGSALAQTDVDIDQIPAAALPSAQPANSSMTSHIYAQGDLTITAARGGLIVPLPPPPPSSMEGRVFLDTRIKDAIGEDLSVNYSGRFNLREESGSEFPARETIRNDLREAYLAWQGGPDLFVDLGRINLKSGVAEGFNPTDYFKTRAVVEPDSADPSVLRDDRLGAVMALGQIIGPKGSLSVAFAPKLAHDRPPYLDTKFPRFDPMLDRTNAHARALIKASFQLLDDLSPELLAYSEAGRAKVGANLTKGLGRATILYLEWSGGRRGSLAYEAYRDGVDNRALPAIPAIPVSGAEDFANDLAVGVGYAIKIGIHLDVEYDYHQAGFSAADWRHWFAGTNVLAQGPLWYIRGYASDQQEPIARSSLFLSADWRSAFIRDLNITAFIDADLRDGSGTGQAAADYFLSPVWTIGGLIDVEGGRSRSDFGSLPQDIRLLLKLTRYFP